MSRQKLIWVKDDPEYESYLWPEDDNEEEIDTEHPEATLEDYADYADQQAESENYHSFVGTHRIIAAFLFKYFGRPLSTEIMRTIAEYGGLPHMREAELEHEGIPSSWLSDGEIFGV